MKHNIQLSGPTISPNTYAGEWGRKYIAAALLSGDTLSKGLITIHPNVAYKMVLRNWSDSISVDAATCDFTDNSSVTLAEYVLTTAEKQVNLELCKKDFATTWEAVEAGYSGFKNIPRDFNSFVIGQVAASVAETIEKGVWSTSLFYNGATLDGLAGYLFHNSAIVAGGAASTTATTSSNVIARLQSMIDDMPDELYGKPGITLYVSQVVAKAYQAAISADGWHDESYTKQKPWDFQGIPMVVVPGLVCTNASTTDEIQAVLANKNDLHFGTGLMADYNNVQLIDMSPTDGSQNFRIIMRFSGGILATNPTQQTILRVTIA